ncbi:MAG: sensor histidine kinase, partial [Steroidobacteraceae bacterium]
QREDAQKAVTTLEVSRSRAHEREMLLADMHDGLGSQISTARLRVERGEMTQADIIHLLRECSADLHLMVDTLREQNDSLEAALVDYKTRVERRIAEQGIGLAWSLQLDGAPAMTARRMLQVLRIIQESITNAMRHAGAREIIVTARYLGDSVYHIKVEDDGAGIADDVSPGRGLSNMRRRARDLGGSLDVRRRPDGRGTEVMLSFEDRPV